MIKDFKAELAGKVVLVTGASRGIGRAIALAFARQECRIAIIARDSQRLADTAFAITELGAEAFTQVLDICDEKAVLAGLDVLRQKFGKVDILVNNAGIYKTAAVIGHSSALWQQTINTNLNAAFFYCRELAPLMLASGWGRIINISSISGKQAEIQGAAYSASKFGLIGLTQSLALELAASAVTVNAICPGWVNTDMTSEQLSDPEWTKLNSVSKEESWEIARLSVPQMRILEPEEVADLALYLCGESARGITGQAINICGGMCLS